MAEYIERGKSLEKAVSTGLCDAQGNMYGAGYVVLANDIESIPAANVSPVVHGRWLPIDDAEDAFDCSECDAMVKKRHNYCPNCGAKMDKEE